MWPKDSELEGTAEVYLKWKNIVAMILMFSVLFGFALWFDSYIGKVVCWILILWMNAALLKPYGPCVTAIFVTLTIWYVYFEWFKNFGLLFLIPLGVTLLEVSYTFNRMRFINRIRSEEGIII